jgi:hypothetical protein
MSFPSFTFDPLTVQEVIERPVSSKAEARKEIFNLTSPYNFYVHVSDLKNEDRYLYFYAWSLGKLKNVIWGYFDFASDTFFVEGECSYTGLNQMVAINRYMESQGFIMVFNIVESWQYKVFIRDAAEAAGLKKPAIQPVAEPEGSFLQQDVKSLPPQAPAIVEPEIDIKGIPINQYDVDLSLIEDAGPEQLKLYRQTLSVVADRFLRTIEKSENYAVTTIEKKCTDPGYCIKNRFLNFLMEDLDPEDLQRCSLYYNGLPELRKSEKYQLYNQSIDFSREPSMQ